MIAVIILLAICFCIMAIVACVVTVSKNELDRKYKQSQLERRDLKREIDKLKFELDSEKFANQINLKNAQELRVKNAELDTQLKNVGVTQEGKEQNKKEIEQVNKILQDKLQELKNLENICNTTKENIKSKREEIDNLGLQLERLAYQLKQKQAAGNSVDNFEKNRFNNELPYIDYEDFFSKNNFEVVLKLLDDCIEVAPQFKTELRKIEGSLCYLPYKKTFIKEFSRSGIYMLEVKAKYEEKVLKELELKRINDGGSIVYIGQSTNIYDRGTTHIKKMLEIEPSGGEKVYKFKPLMFKGKVIEGCDSSELDEREKFGIDSFKSDQFGLNNKSGNKNKD